jgi:hypothetical protein
VLPECGALVSPVVEPPVAVPPLVQPAALEPSVRLEADLSSGGRTTYGPALEVGQSLSGRRHVCYWEINASLASRCFHNNLDL